MITPATTAIPSIPLTPARFAAGTVRRDPEHPRRVLSEPGLADGMAEQAAGKAPELFWAAVAGRYRAVAAGLVATDLAGVS